MTVIRNRGLALWALSALGDAKLPKRTRGGFNAAELARALGVSASTVSRWIAQTATPRPAQARALHMLAMLATAARRELVIRELLERLLDEGQGELGVRCERALIDALGFGWACS